MSKENLLPLVAGATLLASSSFALGVYVDHAHIYKKLTELIKTDAYAFFLKDKLLAIFSNFQATDKEPPNRLEQLMQYGFPGLDDIRVFSNFVLSYDRRNRVAHWVLEHLTADCVSNRYGVNRRFSTFQSDLAIPSLFRSHNSDYFRSGFDRGHLAAAANHKGHQTHCDETFYLTNIAPQVGRGFNRDAWNNLEIYARGLTSVYPDVYVCTGSVYLPKWGFNNRQSVQYDLVGVSLVAIPTHFFKIIVCKTKSEDRCFLMESYLLPNEFIDDNIDLKTFRRPPETIEKASGLTFFDKIKRNEFVSINGTLLPVVEEVD